LQDAGEKLKLYRRKTAGHRRTKFGAETLPTLSCFFANVAGMFLWKNVLMDFSATERARRIRLILFDVDGVLTDGKIWTLPLASVRPSAGSAGEVAPVHTEENFEAKEFHAQDGVGISLARIGGIHCGFVTKRSSEAVAQRARALRIEYLFMGQDYKMRAVEEIIQRGSFTIDQIAYVGDDVIDLPVMRVCGLAIAVANARDQVKAVAHYVTPHSGGQGAGRDATDFVLESHGILDRCIEEYLDERNAPAAVIAAERGGG
jgi:3-deoxy-D-manno-octulosonate 8-phosphate phosphatase (KDO 8-P phosphatase)